MSDDNTQINQLETTQSPSQEAYEKVQPKIPTLQQAVLNIITDAGPNGVTASEVIRETNQLDYSIRPRITELKEQGRIVKQGKRPNARGSNETVWVLAEFAIQAA